MRGEGDGLLGVVVLATWLWGVGFVLADELRY
jgi:hypothetical protein